MATADVYLDAAERIPADIYELACKRLVATWENEYQAPLPGQILKVARLIVRERRSTQWKRDHEELKANAMPPDERNRLLSGLTEKLRMIKGGRE